jgi:hypothetical protein
LLVTKKNKKKERGRMKNLKDKKLKKNSSLKRKGLKRCTKERWNLQKDRNCKKCREKGKLEPKNKIDK